MDLPIGKLLDKVWKQGVAKSMAAAGYRYSARTLCREEDGVHYLIELQGNKWNEGCRGRFCINLGVGYGEIDRRLELLPCLSYLKNLKPCIGSTPHHERLGHLWKNTDHWWELGPETDIEALIEELHRLLLDLGLPWLKSRNSPATLVEENAVQSPILVAARHLLGPPEELAAALEALIARKGPWGDEATLQEWVRHMDEAFPREA